MPNPYRRYIFLVLTLFAMAWPVLGAARALYEISFCKISYFVPGINYVAYCGDPRFGDFEHQVFYNGMFDTDRRLREADVIFLGNSRVQFAFSRGNIAPFFAERHSRFFVAAFGYVEGWEFAAAVLKRNPARPKILVLNVDASFFGGTRPSPVAKFPMERPIAGFIDAVMKATAQSVYAVVCQQCGRSASLMRSRETGQWDLRAADPDPPIGEIPLVSIPLSEKNELPQWLTIAVPQARELLAVVPARCIVLTEVPNNSGPVGAYVQALAPRLDAKVILPVVANLRSYDGNHLDAASAVSWSNAFLDQLAKLGPECGAW